MKKENKAKQIRSKENDAPLTCTNYNENWKNANKW